MSKIYTILILAIILFFSYGIITKKDTSPLKKEKRVLCQEKTITFEKIGDKTLMDDAFKLLESGNYIIKSKIEQAVHMQSQILNHTCKEKADKILIETIKPYIKELKKSNKKLLIDYYISENDKEDINKKGTKCKLYAGYLVFEFKLDKKLIYKIQTDYMKTDTSDIPERMQCVLKSFTTLKEK